MAMNQAELTPAGQSRYDGDMSAGASIEQSSRVSESEVTPGPLSEAGRSLWQAAKNGTETDVAPPESQTDARQFATDKLAETGRRPMTRDELVRVAQTIQSKPAAGEVLADAQFVSHAAQILIRNIESDVENYQVNKDLLEHFKTTKLLDEAKRVAKLIEGMPPDGQDTENEDSTFRMEKVKAEAGRVADLARKISVFYEKAKLSREYDDPFRQIVSFEELMTKFNITLDDERFQPGGEFSLLDVHEYVDKFGRQVSTEEAHPENFLRWVTERAWFYHDFDPMKDINLFEGMYIVAGSRKISMYEMLVDFNAYFAHRVPTKGELKVLQEDLARAKDQKTFEYSNEYKKWQNKEGEPPAIIGYYLDAKTGKKLAYVKNIPEGDDKGRQTVLPVFSIDENGVLEDKPVVEWLASKEQWQTVPPNKNPEFENAQTEIMYQLWLMTRNHNEDVAYRQKGMPNEKPLSETLAELYSDNIWTRTQRRLRGIMDMPATTFRGEVDENGGHISEAAKKWKGEYTDQGSLGKAFQRSLAAWYHIGEANAAFNGYTLDGGLNPFVEVLKRGDINGAEIFYKRLIQRTLFQDKKFGYVSAGYNEKDESTWEKSKIEVEFFKTLNATRIPGKDGTSRKRFEWEKADFVSFVSLSKSDFLSEMANRQITAESLNKAFKDLKEKYTEANNQERLQDLHALEARLNQGSPARREAFIDSLVGKAGIKEEAKTQQKEAKKGFVYSFLHPDTKDGMKGLDLLAVGLFTKSFPSEFTPDINPFVNIRYSLNARERTRAALRDALSFTEKLDEFDAKWAEEWAYTFTFHTGISARNDMQGIGHDAWSKVLNTEFYRLRQSGGGNYPGNLDNLYGIHRLGTDFWQGLKVQTEGSGKYDKTMYEILTGLTKRADGGYVFDTSTNVAQFEFAGNAMRQFYADHVSHAIDLFIDLTQKQEFNLDKLVKKDNFGNLIWNNEDMQKMIDSTWKHMRYGFDNNGFLYDSTNYGWLYDEKISEKGAVSRTPHFGLMSLRELMFSKKVRDFNMYGFMERDENGKEIYRPIREDVSSWTGEDVYHTKMGRNVFAYIIAAQLREHTRNDGGYRVYSAEEVEMITRAFVNYAARVMRGENGETIYLGGFFTPEEIEKILACGHSVLWMMYLRELGFSTTGGFLFGLFDALLFIMKDSLASIKL